MMRNLLLLAAVLAAPVAAQTLEPGYETVAVTPLPNGASSVAVLPGGDLVWFTGTDLMLQRAGARTSVLRFSTPVFGSFTIDVGQGRVLFGESSAGDLWLVDTNGTARPRVVANLPLNYDAVLSGADTVIVSAKVGGFASPDNDLIQVTLSTGAIDRIALVPGASGPVAWTNDGLWYATASASFPPPLAAVDVIHWGRAQLFLAIGAGYLTPAQGFVMATGLDSASALVVDRDFDPIVVDWMHDRVFEVSIGPSGGRNRELRRSTLIGYAPSMPLPAGLQLVQDATGFQFEPFQPAAGGLLAVVESTYGGVTQVRSIRPVRPVTNVPAVIPPGRFMVTTTGGPARGTGLVAVGPNILIRESGLPVNGFDQVVQWDQSMLFAWDTIPVTFDAAGTAALPLFNPGVPAPALSVGLQVAFVDANLEVIGSAAPVLLALR